MSGKIHLKNLTVETLIGVDPHERKKKQPLICELILEVDLKEVIKKDDMSSTVDYSAVAHFVSLFANNSTFYLIERFRIELAKALTQKFSFLSLHLFIQKPNALKELAEVSFEYFHRA